MRNLLFFFFWWTYDAPPDHLVGWGGDPPPQTPFSPTPTALRSLVRVPSLLFPRFKHCNVWMYIAYFYLFVWRIDRLTDCVCVGECGADPPYFVIRPPPFYQLQPQQTVVIPCSAAGEPPPTITWRRVCNRTAVSFCRPITSIWLLCDACSLSEACLCLCLCPSIFSMFSRTEAP